MDSLPFFLLYAKKQYVTKGISQATPILRSDGGLWSPFLNPCEIMSCILKWQSITVGSSP